MRTMLVALSAVASIAVALAALIVAHRSARVISIHDVPYAGFQVGDNTRARLPSGGTVLVVGEDCQTSTERADAFFSRVLSREDHVLLVATSTLGNATFRRMYTDVRTGAPQIDQRVHFVTRDELFDDLHVSATPTFISIDAEGRVVNAGVSTVGLFRSVMSPGKVAAAWRSMARNLFEGRGVVSRASS